MNRGSLVPHIPSRETQHANESLLPFFLNSNDFIYCVILFSKKRYSVLSCEETPIYIYTSSIVYSQRLSLSQTFNNKVEFIPFNILHLFFPNVWATMGQSPCFLTQSLPPVRALWSPLRRDRFTLSKKHYELCWLESKPFNKSPSLSYTFLVLIGPFVCPKDTQVLQS